MRGGTQRSTLASLATPSPAREWDPETGLYYYRARYYDPKIGRFISEDPIQSGSYAYAGNSPAVYGDPTGVYLELRGANWQKALAARGESPERTSVGW